MICSAHLMLRVTASDTFAHKTFGRKEKTRKKKIKMVLQSTLCDVEYFSSVQSASNSQLRMLCICTQYIKYITNISTYHIRRRHRRHRRHRPHNIIEQSTAFGLMVIYSKDRIENVYVNVRSYRTLTSRIPTDKYTQS